MKFSAESKPFFFLGGGVGEFLQDMAWELKKIG